MTTRFQHVDAFTDRAFAGNPAGVCLMTADASAEWMQRAAAEVNLSETAFVQRRTDGDYDLRWFTPTVEVDLCGHATLATAHSLWELGALDFSQTARFYTRSGILTAIRCCNWIELNFPASAVEPAPPPAGLFDALGVRSLFLGKTRFDYLVEVESEDVVRHVAPNYAALRGLGVRGVMITARSSRPEADFVSRFFAPGAGIDEDPVTGSAHCALAPYWQKKFGKDELVGYQASSRGGTVRCRVAGDRVRLRGQAVTVVRGEWLATQPG